jgi:hypothetical protein
VRVMKNDPGVVPPEKHIVVAANTR